MSHARRSVGFTLVELLVAITLVGTLAALVVSGYSRYRARVLRATAIDCLVEAQRRQEGWFARFHTYADTLASLRLPDTCHGRHEYAVDLLPAEPDCPRSRCYEITATPDAALAADGVLRLRYDVAQPASAQRLSRTRDLPTGEEAPW